MAISSTEISENKNVLKLPSMPNGKGGQLSPSSLITMEYGSNEIVVNGSKRHKKKTNRYSTSPYISDRVQLLSRVTERRLVAHRKAADFITSFPLTGNIYKASSDDLKALKHNNRNARKSVLTLPKEQSPMPQLCTVSDINDSEYYQDEDKPKLKCKKRLPVQNRKSRPRNRDFEFYDRDARHCSQMNIDLDCSSTEMINNYEGDGKRVSSKSYSTKTYTKESRNTHDVWTVLRNINRFQFRPSPHISEESVISSKKKKGFVRKRNNRKNRRNSSIIETCTEEIAYLAKFEVDRKSPASASQSSSYDRITVIDKEAALDGVHQDINKTLTQPQTSLKAIKGTRNTQQPTEKNIKNACKITAKAKVPLSKNNRTGPVNNFKYINKNNQEKLKDSSGSSLYKDSQDSSNYNRLCRYTDSDDIFANDVQLNERKEQSHNERVLSGHSELSKNFLKKFTKDKLVGPLSEESNQQIRGMTKVVLNNDQDIVLPNCLDGQIRKPRLVTTMPSAAIMPKLTTADIKRRLAHIKFPLVILGKDQISSTIEVLDYDPPQFNGLDEHIWPFMVDWTEKQHQSAKYKSNLPQNRRSMLSVSTNNLRKVNNEIALNKPSREKKNIHFENITTKKKIEPKRLPHPVELSSALPQSNKKAKPLRQFKDKMLKLLFKKSSYHRLTSTNGQNRPNALNDSTVVKGTTSTRKQVNASTETCAQVEIAPKDISKFKKSSIPVSSFPKITMCSPPVDDKQSTKYPWARAKWASDFIENVIGKMRDGAYYNQEESYMNTIKNSNKNKIDIGFIDHVINKLKNSAYVDLKDTAIQTPTTMCEKDAKEQKNSQCLDSLNDDLAVKIPRFDNDLSVRIPGFDEELPALEVKTLNMNEIAIKHCLTNVMVQFDVTVPEALDSLLVNVNESSSCIPIVETESHTKIFKCKTTIVNAVLPAEICSVLPKIMRNFLDSKINFNIPVLPLNAAVSQLSTITEDTLLSSRVSLPMLTLPTFTTSPDLMKLLQGMFSGCLTKPISTESSIDRTISFKTYKLCSEIINKVSKLLFENIQSMFPCGVDPYNMSRPTIAKPCNASNNQNLSEISHKNTCTALQLYTGNNNFTNPLGNFDLSDIVRRVLTFRITNISFNTPSYFNPFEPKRNDFVTLNLELQNNQDHNMTITISKLKVNSLFTAFPKRRGNNIGKNEAPPMKAVEYPDNSRSKVAMRNLNHQVSVGSKIRRKGFVRLYKKCKSTSNISGERYSTALSKIANLDDVFQALGSGKLLSSVFEGVTGQKILTSIFQMKDWITEITPRQTMLVLLLTNKKDTPNLSRFRPVLLQGIAVKRITRATELDMEIEVIEREKFNKLPQYEGISYLPASVENQDSLLEELSWIAKTTASDYQKPFDESSEQLLKSLLEKRKTLNPSYLRVMARYVGLGLLKAPKHK